jgi:hypothetical protein
MKTAYENELQRLKPQDEIQGTEKCRFSGYPFIYTAGHGYLCIPKGSADYITAERILNASLYGYKGKLAVYLEEDQEAPDFLKKIGKYPTIKAQ